MKFPKNEGPADRAIRVVAGLLLFAVGMFVLDAPQPTVAGVVVAVIGVFSLVTGFTGRCVAYIPFGINTNTTKQRHPAPVR